MKDFDQEREYRSEADRDFVLRGQHFRAKASVRPEVRVPFEEIGDATPPAEVLKIIDELILAMIEPNDDAYARYRALREQENDPITLDDLQDLAKWLHEASTGRPTEQPGASSNGPGETGTASTATSSSQDAPAA